MGRRRLWLAEQSPLTPYPNTATPTRAGRALFLPDRPNPSKFAPRAGMGSASNSLPG